MSDPYADAPVYKTIPAENPDFNPGNQPTLQNLTQGLQGLQGLQAPATIAIATPIGMPEVQEKDMINPEKLEELIREAYKQGYLDACKDKCKDGVVEAGLQRTSTKPYVKYLGNTASGVGRLSKKHKKGKSKHSKSKHSKLSRRVKKLTKRVKKLSKKLKAKTKKRKQSP